MPTRRYPKRSAPQKAALVALFAEDPEYPVDHKYGTAPCPKCECIMESGPKAPSCECGCHSVWRAFMAGP